MCRILIGPCLSVAYIGSMRRLPLGGPNELLADTYASSWAQVQEFAIV
jgi:hypothetical protein